MGTVNGGTIISFTPTPSLHAVNSRMPPMPSHHPTGCANFTFQLPSTERRANHNAVERARRECLNTKFQELAHALPSLAQVRRPSKSIIVQKSLEFIYNARKKDEEMRSIRNENDLLRKEVNRLRDQLGLDPLPPHEESKSSTSQQADDEKEDVKISNSKNSNTPEIKIEADNNTPTISNAQESSCSIDIQIKNEGSRSDDDFSNEDDYDMETTEMIDKSSEINQSIDNNQQQSSVYDGLYLLDPGLNQHSYPTSGFGFAMDISPIDQQIVDPNSLHLQFDDDISAYCDTFSLQQEYYPSPPYEANLLELANHMPYSLSPDNSHNI
ncbi:4002_t:CDS:2 [Funneliformis geosporum]|uniref:9594_t:CDS:1 n=1 Tax=Funneliformis geosporum TaxID=1117311 RepID=A0A9W4WLB3_9GLOM|nr:4002_t:CDS:2 [Funneliformis geosporum]CAI2170073.1 9594_t:CDS:2 [Funneliformis geosporum]